MNFEDILPHVKAGGKARRAIWDNGHRTGAHLILVQPSLPEDSKPLMPLLVVNYEAGENVLRPFAGANWDLLAGDWEIIT